MSHQVRAVAVLHQKPVAVHGVFDDDIRLPPRLGGGLEHDAGIGVAGLAVGVRTHPHGRHVGERRGARVTAPARCRRSRVPASRRTAASRRGEGAPRDPWRQSSDRMFPGRVLWSNHAAARTRRMVENRRHLPGVPPFVRRLRRRRGRRPARHHGPPRRPRRAGGGCGLALAVHDLTAARRRV